MLTHESLRKLKNDEKASKSIMPLPQDFFQQFQSYVEAKERLTKDPWEIESAKRLLQDLLEIREKKLLDAAFYCARSGELPDNLSRREKAFLDGVVEHIRKFHSRGEGEVEMLRDVPEFVAPDMSHHGPFRKGDAAKLPPEVASLLVEKGAARAK